MVAMVTELGTMSDARNLKTHFHNKSKSGIIRYYVKEQGGRKFVLVFTRGAPDAQS
jgi:hypothetical protein